MCRYYTTTFEYPMLLPPPNNFDRHSDISVTTQKSGSIQPPQKASGQILLSFFPSLWLSDGSSIPKARVLEVLPSKNWLKALVYSTNRYFLHFLTIFGHTIWWFFESIDNVKLWTITKNWQIRKKGILFNLPKYTNS